MIPKPNFWHKYVSQSHLSLIFAKPLLEMEVTNPSLHFTWTKHLPVVVAAQELLKMYKITADFFFSVFCLSVFKESWLPTPSFGLLLYFSQRGKCCEKKLTIVSQKFVHSTTNTILVTKHAVIIFQKVYLWHEYCLEV